jgi:hypothetical protein
MPRPATIWQRKQDNFYYVKINGKQTKLSQDRDEAEALFYDLKAGQKDKKKRTRPAALDQIQIRITLEDPCNCFLDHAEKTYQNQRDYLQSFCDHVGKTKRVLDLRGSVLDDWSTSQGWARSTQTAARAPVLACLN